MSNWKKIVVSGSQAHLSSVTASNGSIISGSLTMSGSIRTVDYIDFIEATGSKVPTELPGRIYYDREEDALTVYSNIADTELYVGQETHYLVKNNSGTTINAGQLVMFSGSIGNSSRLTAQLCDQTKLPSSVYVMGVASNTMTNGEDGFVVAFGKIKGINATGTPVSETWNNGDVLYIHPTIPGAFTKNEPTEGKWKLIVAAVVNNTANGTIFVRLTPANNIGELDNVKDSSSTAGDLLVKSGSVWKSSKQLTGSYGLTGSLQATSFTGSLQGSASYAIQSLSSSYATTASYVLGGAGGATVTNPGDNYVITSDGTSGGLVGENNLTFDGSTLAVTGNVTATSFTGSSFTGSYTGSLQYFEYNVGSNYTQGIGIGNGSTNNYTRGIGIGETTYNNFDYGIGIGYEAFGNYTKGIGIGTFSQYNSNRGIGIGWNATNNNSDGVGIGYLARYNFGGVGIGAYSDYNSNGGVGVGYYATSNQKGYGSVAIGSFSKTERQNEFVTTATNSATNKAQSIIQKFRQKSLASNGGVNQEIYTDASSARVTIQASSVYQFRIQINAIQSTSVICKTWEVVGAIKRNASNTTSMIGTPVYTVTSEDTGTANWDVTVDADDTNESLRLRVKHDAANNVIFSATIWATETRI